MFIPDVPQMPSGKHERYWESVGDAVAANTRLRSLHVNLPNESSHELPVMMEGLCRNERLTELSLKAPEVRGMCRVSIVVLN